MNGLGRFFRLIRSDSRDRRPQIGQIAHNVGFPATIESARFMHHMRCILRSRGGFDDRVDIEDYLTRWIENYVSSEAGDQPIDWARYPLISARIELTSDTTDCYRVESYLQLRRTDGKIDHPLRLVADLPTGPQEK